MTSVNGSPYHLMTKTTSANCVTPEKEYLQGVRRARDGADNPGQVWMAKDYFCTCYTRYLFVYILFFLAPYLHKALSPQQDDMGKPLNKLEGICTGIEGNEAQHQGTPNQPRNCKLKTTPPHTELHHTRWP